MTTQNQLQKLEKQRLAAIKAWDTSLLSKLEGQISVLKAKENEEIDKIIAGLKELSKPIL